MHIVICIVRYHITLLPLILSATGVWSASEQKGPLLSGSFGHSSVYSEDTGLIYLIGSDTGRHVMASYNPAYGEWYVVHTYVRMYVIECNVFQCTTYMYVVCVLHVLCVVCELCVLYVQCVLYVLCVLHVQCVLCVLYLLCVLYVLCVLCVLYVLCVLCICTVCTVCTCTCFVCVLCTYVCTYVHT